jgi:serine/threonine-protein kinase
MHVGVGDTVGPYRIVEQLGQGGMATVFKGYHAALDRYVAIKVLHPDFKTDAAFLGRFQREARVVARLEHPNIVPIYDYAEHDGAPYLVMKFIEGETLKARLARGPLAVAEVLRCVEAVGAALAFAHGQGALHRDVKPSNVMLARDGTIFLTDFGLARIAQAGESTLSTDTLLGTPSYMSPEQARGVKDLDAGTDIYSFGIVLYELVVGEVPFSGDTPYAIVHDHIFTALPRPRELNPKVPESVEAVLIKALAKDRSDRYGSVNEMVAALWRAVSGQGAPDATLMSPSMALAPPLSVPVAPGAETLAASTAVPSPQSGPASAPSAAQLVAGPAVAPATGDRKYRFAWWQALLAALVVGGWGLLALGAASLVRRGAVQAQGTPTFVEAVPTGTARATSTPYGTPLVAATAAQRLIESAESDFSAGRSDYALSQLDQAVAVDPANTAVLLQAGDIALGNNLAEQALARYFLPGLMLENAATDARSGLMGSHAALSYYVAAADPQAGPFLDRQVAQFPGSVLPLLAQQRFKIFHNAGQGVLDQLTGVSKDKPQGLLAELILGDYYLARGQDAAAARHYAPLSLLHLANGQVPDWVIREARCEIGKMQLQGTNAKLEAACVDLSSLLTGK